MTIKNMPTLFRIFFFCSFVCLFSVSLPAQDKTTEQLALQYYNAGEFARAAELYGELFQKTPNTFYYTYYLNSLLESGNYREAERVVKGLKETRELRRNFTVELGFVYQRQGDQKKAEREYERAIERMQPTRIAVVDLANAFLIRRLPEYAVRVYLKGRKEIPEPYQFNLELASVYQSARNYPSMMDEYLNLIAADETRLSMVQNTLQHLMNTFADESFNQVVRGKIIERAQKFPDQMIFSELLLWYSIQQKEFGLALSQARAIERRIRDEGETVFNVGRLAASNAFYDVATEAFEYIRSKGENHFLYLQAEMMLLDVRFAKLMKASSDRTSEIRSLSKDYHRILAQQGSNASTIHLIRNHAHLLAFYLDSIESAVALLEQAIKIPQVQPSVIAHCKTDLADIYLMSGEVWEATLLYSQVEKAFKYDPVGFEAKLKNARLSFYIGEFDWAKTQLDVLRSATSKLIANDAMELSLLISDNLADDSNIVPLSMFARADLLLFRKRSDQALSVLDSLAQLFPGHNIQDDVLLKRAEIMIAMKSYQTADSLLSLLITKYAHDILVDNALITQARLHDYHLNNKVKAMELYEQIVLNHPGSVFVTEARNRFRELRSSEPING
jgi:tetratricopeptide (TPR) repeat protein